MPPARRHAPRKRSAVAGRGFLYPLEERDRSGQSRDGAQRRSPTPVPVA
ncbi:hypothetical protein A3768_4501 (plasmid) [Ralstonia solanacearum]|nr:hypothetical protein A3768_4501 [Ralstonia solanacearum]